MSGSAVLLGCLTILAWGLGAFFDKLAVGHLPPKAVFFARLYLMVAVFLAPMILAWEDTRLAVWRADRKVIAYLLGTMGFTMGGMFIYYHALARAEASKLVPFCSIYPFVAFFLAVALLKEPLTSTKLLGALLAVGGTILLSRE